MLAINGSIRSPVFSAVSIVATDEDLPMCLRTISNEFTASFLPRDAMHPRY